MRCESRFGSGEQPTTAHTRVPVRIARTSSTGGSSADQPGGQRGHGARRGARARARCRRSGRRSDASRASRSRRRSPVHLLWRTPCGLGARAPLPPRPRGRTAPTRRPIPSAARSSEHVVVRCQGRKRERPPRGRRVVLVGELAAHVVGRVVARQDRCLGVPDEPPEAARRRGLPRGAVALRRPLQQRARGRHRPAARAGPRRPRAIASRRRPRGAPSRQQCSQPAGVRDGESLPVVVEVREARGGSRGEPRGELLELTSL